MSQEIIDTYVSGLNGPEDINILGLGLLSDVELEGVIEAVAKLQKGHPAKAKFTRATNKAVKIGVRQGGGETSIGFGKDSRVEVMRRLVLLPPVYRQGLLGKQLRIADVLLYQTKPVAIGTNNMFTTGDIPADGIGNIGNAKIQDNRPFLVTAVQVVAGVSAAANGLDAVYAIPQAGLLNGDFTLTVQGSEKIAKTPCRAFDTANRNDRAMGTYVLDSPFWILPNAEIKLPLTVVAALAANTWAKVVFHGAQVSEN